MGRLRIQVLIWYDDEKIGEFQREFEIRQAKTVRERILEWGEIPPFPEGHNTEKKASS